MNIRTEAECGGTGKGVWVAEGEGAGRGLGVAGHRGDGIDRQKGKIQARQPFSSGCVYAHVYIELLYGAQYIYFRRIHFLQPSYGQLVSYFLRILVLRLY